MREQIGPAIRVFIFLTFLTGGVYPLLITGIAQIGFSKQANGSLLMRNGKVIGSELIAQKFENQKHFWARPSTADYNPLPSGGSNLGPTSQDLKSKTEERKKLGLQGELLFASASGLDPHISPESARRQLPRILNALSLNPSQRDAISLKATILIDAYTENRQHYIFGESRVNVLKLNLAWDEIM